MYMPRLHLSAIALPAGLYLCERQKSTCPGCLSALLRCLQACTFAKVHMPRLHLSPKPRTFAGLPAQVASQAQEGGTPSLSQPLTGSQGLHAYIAIGETVGQRSRGKTSAAAEKNRATQWTTSFLTLAQVHRRAEPPCLGLCEQD